MDVPPYSSLLPTRNAAEPLRVAIIAENFLPKIDGSTVTLAHLLEHLSTTPNVQAMLFGPESGMKEYAGAPLFGTLGLPLPAYPGLSINFLSPSFLSALRQFEPHIIHLVDPIWLGVQTLFSVLLLFPHIPIVTSHHTNLPTYARVFGYPYWEGRTWGVQGWLHSWGGKTLVPTPSTGRLLGERGYVSERVVVGRGVDENRFHPSFRSHALRAQWGAGPDDVVVLCVGRLSPEKNLSLLVHAFAALPPDVRPRCKLVFVGDGPYRGELQRLCIQLGVPDAVFTGQLTGTGLSEAFASGDVVSSPSITETFGQVTLQGMAAGLPVVGLYVEGTADLVVHGVTGLLLDPLAPTGTRPTHAASLTEDGLGLGLSCPQDSETGVPLYRTPSTDSAVSLSLDPSPSTSAQRRTAEGESEEEEDIPIPDSAVCLSPTPFGRAGEGEMEALELPPAQLTLPSPSHPVEEQDASSFYPFESPDPSAPRVGCFRTLAPLMRPEAKEWEGVVKAYAGLVGVLVRSPSLREDMGKRAHARSTRFRWAGCSQRVVDAYFDACLPRVGALEPSRSTSLSSASSSSNARTPRFILGRGKAKASDTEVRNGGEGEGDPLLLHRTTSGNVANDKGPYSITASSPLLPKPSHSNASTSTSTVVHRVTAGVTWVIDALVVVGALVAATLSHAAYMVPSGEDLWRR